MNCVICKTGELHPGHATVTLNRENTVMVIKQVPAEVCDNCGEYYLSDDVSETVLGLAEDAMLKGAEKLEPKGDSLVCNTLSGQ